MSFFNKNKYDKNEFDSDEFDSDEFDNDSFDNDAFDDDEEKSLFQKLFPVLSTIIILAILIIAGILVYQSFFEQKKSTSAGGEAVTPTVAAALTDTPAPDTATTPDAALTPEADSASGTGTASEADSSSGAGSTAEADSSSDAGSTAGADSSPGSGTASPEAAGTGQAEESSGFTTVSESVTAKEIVNLRSKPDRSDDSTIIGELSNGEVVTRTGIGNNGWSQLEYNGQTCYAVSSYLTTDLEYQSPGLSSQDTSGIKTVFTDISDVVTAKEKVNLRTLPSVTNADSTVVATISNGETITRTGINEDVGWSRVEYNGQTLYCVSSYLTTP
jgi:uncharacterized protein YgiM (DUF1202 family)